MKKIITTIWFGLIASSAWAHEGHDHGSLSAPNGGAVKEGKKLNVELVQEGKKIKLYPVNRAWKLISPLKDVEMSAQIEFPNKKAETLLLKKETDHFSAEVDAKGAYRYKMMVSLSVKRVKEDIEFNVEPQ